MNSVRAPRRWVDVGARRSPDFDRAALLLIAACAVLFSLSFVVGRVLSSASPAGQGTLPRIAAAHTGDDLPVSLSAAPAILPGAVVAHVNPSTRRRVTANRQPAAAAVLQTPATVTSSAPVATSTAPVAAPPAKAPERPTKSAPAPSKRSGGGGVSFDSSG
jgi:hypothetical protein